MAGVSKKQGHLHFIVVSDALISKEVLALVLKASTTKSLK